MAADTIGKTQAEQLQHLRDLLDEATFQQIQGEVWKQFSLKAAPIGRDGVLMPLALFSVWDELRHALQEAVKRAGREKELASRVKPKDGPLWEVLKNGATWSAMLRFRRDHRDWEVVILHNRQRRRVEHFPTAEQAETWADKECIEITMGWKE